MTVATTRRQQSFRVSPPGSTLSLPRSTASSFSTEPDISGAIAHAVDAGSDDLTMAGSKVATILSRCMNAASTSQQEVL